MSEPVVPSESAELTTQLLQYRASLFDPGTGLPSLPAVMDHIRKMLEDQRSVQVLVIRIEQEQSLELIVGWERYDALLQSIAEYLKESLSSFRGAGSVLCQDHVRGDRFLVFLPDRRQTGRLLELVSEPIVVGGGEPAETFTLGLRVGQGSIRPRPSQRIERCIFGGLEEAEKDFSRRRRELDLSRLRELQQILRSRSVRTLFQPIFRVPQRTIVGYEALCRGPEGSYLEPAERILGFAERSGMLGELEELCIEKALSNGHRLPLGSTLFLNLSFRGLEYLEGERGGLMVLARQAGWSPREIVLEITEHTYAEDPERILKRVMKLRSQGFRVAIDDMGTGYSSLHTLADVKPDYIKLDGMLVQGIASEPIKRNLISAIIGFAHTSQSLVIAEGVERQEEVTALQDLGVFLLQGFFFARPKAVE
jgi:EAL domain-containing protein (putative c-di-GMP-specific phosphodiesterase class I)/GGDEF domain-containing protein